MINDDYSVFDASIDDLHNGIMSLQFSFSFFVRFPAVPAYRMNRVKKLTVSVLPAQHTLPRPQCDASHTQTH